MPKALITGSAGFIGDHLAQELLAHNCPLDVGPSFDGFSVGRHFDASKRSQFKR